MNPMTVPNDYAGQIFASDRTALLISPFLISLAFGKVRLVAVPLSSIARIRFVNYNCSLPLL